jgi:Holliday junction resolvase
MTNGKSARRKGHDFERKVVNIFKEWGWTVLRMFQGGGGKGLPDVRVDDDPWEDAHLECKALKKMAIYTHIRQARADAGHREPCVVFKEDGEEIYIAMPLTLALNWSGRINPKGGNSGQTKKKA